MAKKIFSWDAMANGSWGKAFSIGAVLYEDGKEVKSFYARRPIKEKIDPWVQSNVLPELSSFPVTHSNHISMLSSFAEFLIANIDDADILFNMGIPIKARVILDLYDLGFIDETDGEYSWIDISGCLKQAGYKSVDEYNAKYSVTVPQADLSGTNNPLYNSRAIAQCYMNLIS